MAVIEVNRDPTVRELRQFGFVWLAFLLLFAGLARWRFDSPRVAAALAVLAVLVPVIGWVAPRFMRWVFVGLSLVAFPIGFVVSHLVLALVYYGVITPIGLAMRAFGHDAMCRRLDPAASSYWVERERTTDPKRHFRQL